MSTQSFEDVEDPVVRYLNRHLVPIYFAFRKGTARHTCMITTFVLSVRNQWLLITAGHCITSIKEELLDKGYEIERCRLIDCMGSGAVHADPIPFDYLAATPEALSKDEKYDYGAIFLDDHYVRLLKANGVEPLNEEVWGKQPHSIDFFVLLGVPDQLSETTFEKAYVTCTLHKVEELAERPDCFEETDAPTFWGKIHIAEPMSNIGGMSGGPLFAFRRCEDGRLRYWLHAIQSRWFKSSHLVAACLSNPLGVLIKEVMEGKHPHLVGSVPSSE